MLDTRETIESVLKSYGRTTPDAPALVAPGQAPMCFATLAALLDDVMATLNGWGIGRGDRVAMLIAERPQSAAAFLAVSSCTTSVALDPTIGVETLEALLPDLRAKAMIVSGRGDMESLAHLARRLGIALITLTPDRDGPAGAFTLSGGTPGEARLPGPAGPDDEITIFLTSGSTSRQKLVATLHRRMIGTSRALIARYGITAQDRYLNFMPLFHVHGLHNSFLTPIIAGGSAAVTPEFDPDAFYAWLDECEPTWFGGTQVYLHAVLRNAERYRDIIGRNRLRCIRGGSSAISAELAGQLEETFGARVVILYGSTEAGTICSTAIPPAARDLSTVGTPLVNAVAFLAPDGHIAKQARAGEIVVRGPALFSGYDNDPEATAEAFVDGWFRTGDVGEMTDDGFIRITGRVKEMIVRGGESIHPGEVEAVLLKHADVRDAACFAIPHPTMGQDVGAAVVLRDGAMVEPSDIAAFAADRLTAHKAPRRIFLVDEIPRGAVGKPKRLELTQTLRPRWDSAAEEARPPEAGLESKLAAIVASILEVEAIDADDDLFALGADSLSAVEILAAIDRDLGVTLAADTLWTEGATVAGLAGAIRAAESGTPAEPEPPAEPLEEAIEAPAASVGYTSPQPLIAAKDLLQAASLPLLYTVGKTVPERHWQAFARASAGIVATLVPGRARARAASVRRLFGERCTGADDEDLAQRIDGAAIERRLRMLAGLGPDRWQSPIKLVGREHLQDALDRGRGAILWMAPMRFNSPLTHWKLARAGYGFAMLSRPEHGFSSTRFSQRFLNRFSGHASEAEERERIVITDDGREAIEAVRRRLRDNGIVGIAAGRQSERPIRLPLLDSEIVLALGPARMALATDAELLPLIAVRRDDGAFEVVIEKPIRPVNGARGIETAEAMLRDYVTVLEAYAVRHPADWGRWQLD